LLRAGLAPYVEREFANAYKDNAQAEARRLLPFQANVALPLCLTPMGGGRLRPASGPSEDRMNGNRPIAQWDAWNDVFARTLGRAERSLVQELRDVRNRWAHQEAFGGDYAYRALDSVHRIMVGRVEVEVGAHADLLV